MIKRKYTCPHCGSDSFEIRVVAPVTTTIQNLITNTEDDVTDADAEFVLENDILDEADSMLETSSCDLELEYMFCNKCRRYLKISDLKQERLS